MQSLEEGGIINININYPSGADGRRRGFLNLNGAKILVVCGPTASGKTALAVELALRLGGEVVSADSMQVYQGMDIGTAKPTREEMRGIVHHMLDVAQPWESYSVARYVQQAVPVVDDILVRGKVPVVTGGTGLYIDALITGREFATPQPALREELYSRMETDGLPALRAQLEQADPEAAARIHPNDEKRTIRALEVWLSTGKTISQHNRETRSIPHRYSPLMIGLNFAQRPHLWERIDQRVDKMMEQGLRDEVQTLLDNGISSHCTAMQAIGYKEMATALKEGRPMVEVAQEIKLRSRQYAKRQLTWFRRNGEIKWHLWEKEPDFPKSIQYLTNFIWEHGVG